ncbi:MAG: hypothetical protein LWX70_07815 [Sphingobacteriia bacterium]|nr:hypothetical protein [Sphingobacteriia bacterium]
MNNTKAEYQKRLDEVEMYFNTIKVLDLGMCKIVCTDILGNQTERRIDDELSKVLKANGFLLLYNLIEATIRNSISAIFGAMHAQDMTFKKLTDNLRKIWINQEVKNLKKEELLSLFSIILEDKLIKFKAECVNISGNIDAQRIRDIAKQFGYSESRDGRDLVTIKEKRNKLAHGEFTFSEIGKDYSVSELIKFKDNTKDYLQDVLINIENYINNKAYVQL